MRHLYLIALLIIPFQIKAQLNLVPNPNFEIYTSCPDGTLFPNEILRATPWTNPTQCSPEYFHQCGTNGQGVPNNVWGNESAKTGIAYGGLVAFQPTSVRDYIQAKLNDTLEAGKKYLVELYVSLSDNSMYSVNTLATYFSSAPITGIGCNPLNYFPQIINPSTNPLISKGGWTKISDTLIANGGELYMTIGNFNSDTTSDTSYVGGTINEAYYYVDDVIVNDITNVGINESPKVTLFILYPNPTQNSITVEFKYSNCTKATFILYDLVGEQIMAVDLNTSKEIIVLDRSSLVNSIYYYKIVVQNSVVENGKIVLTK